MRVKKTSKALGQFDQFCDVVYNKWLGATGTEKQFDNFKKRILRDWTDPNAMAVWKVMAMSKHWEVT
jgi:hypothetical protein